MDLLFRTACQVTSSEMLAVLGNLVKHFKNLESLPFSMVKIVIGFSGLPTGFPHLRENR